MNATRIEKVPGRRSVTRKLPSCPPKAPAIVKPFVFSRSEIEARGIGLFAVSTILPRISKAGGGPACCAGAWAADWFRGNARDDASRRIKGRDTERPR